MKTFNTPRAQIILLAIIALSVVALCIFAVRSANHLSECEAKARAYQSTQQQQDEETLWCPSTWAPITTLTCLLVIVTAGLWVFTAMLWATTQRAVGDGEKASNAAQVAAEAAKASVELANKEFIASHRAKIIVRNMHPAVESFFPDEDRDDGDDSFSITVRFYSMNIGETTAIIESIEAAIILKHRDRLLNRDHMLASYPPLKPNLPPPQFNVTQVFKDFGKGHLVQIQAGALLICCIGCVIYRDGRGAMRQTGFARSYNLETKRFDVLDDPEYEYAY